MIRRILCLAIFFLVTLPAYGVDLSRGIILDIPQERIESQLGRLPLSQLTREDSLKIASYRFTGDTVKVLAILVDWSNRPHTYPKETFDSLLFSRDVFPRGSVADYYYEVSYGQVNVVGEARNWYNAGTYTPWFDFELLLYILDPVIDYSQFDANHDGDVDAVTFIRSRNGMEDSQNPNDIWSYAMVYPPGSGPGPFDGVYVSRWNTSPETQPLHDPLYPPGFSGVDTLNKIRVFCHELAHCVGLPDLYDYDAKLEVSTFDTPNDDNDHPLVDWCIMGYYGYGLLSIGSQVPSHFCGWSKKEMGWIDPVGFTGATHIVIYNIEAKKDSSLYLLPIKPSEGEYFLLEYRNPNSVAKFDKLDSDFSCYLWPNLAFGGDSLDRGLLITHVHDSLGAPYWRINSGTPDYPHYTVAVEDAGYNPWRDASYNPEGHVTDSAQWWYAYESRKAAPFSHNVQYQEVFSPSTYPNSNGYFGPSGITVQVDSIVDDRLFAYVYAPIPAFSLLSPWDSSFVPYVITFNWIDANPWGEIRYDLHISTSSNFHPDSTVVYDSLLTTQFVDTLPIGTYYWRVRAYDNTLEKWSSQTQTFFSGKRGDVNGDKAISLADVIQLANYVLKGGVAPYPLQSGDVNCDSSYTLVDVILLARYVLLGEPFSC